MPGQQAWILILLLDRASTCTDSVQGSEFGMHMAAPKLVLGLRCRRLHVASQGRAVDCGFTCLGHAMEVCIGNHCGRFLMLPILNGVQQWLNINTQFLKLCLESACQTDIMCISLTWMCLHNFSTQNCTGVAMWPRSPESCSNRLKGSPGRKETYS